MGTTKELEEFPFRPNDMVPGTMKDATKKLPPSPKNPVGSKDPKEQNQWEK